MGARIGIVAMRIIAETFIVAGLAGYVVRDWLRNRFAG
jgi:hypothetical protein